MAEEPLYDVIDVAIEAPHTVRLMDTNKTFLNADAVMKMAVMRRGVGSHFYKVVPAGTYREGETWRPDNA